MSHSVGNSPVESFICCDVVNGTQSHATLEPHVVRGTTSVQDSVCVHLEPSHALGFNRILKLMKWFRKLISNHEVPVQFCHLATLLCLGIVMAQDTWNSFSSEEVPVDIMKIRFFLHSTEVWAV